MSGCSNWVYATVPGLLGFSFARNVIENAQYSFVNVASFPLSLAHF